MPTLLNNFAPVGEPAAQSFRDFVADTVVWDAEFRQTEPVPIKRIEITDTALIVAENSILLDQPARNRLLSGAGAPVGYLSARNVFIQTLVLREHLRAGAFGNSPRIVLRNGQLFNIQSSNLLHLNHFEVFATVAESLGDAADSLKVSKIVGNGERIELELLSPMKAIEVRRGDIVSAGLHIKHSLLGDEATQIHAFNHRLVCENGMISRECVSSDGIVRTRKLPASHPRAKELEIDQVRRLTARVWRSLDPRLRELRATSERRADVPQLFRSWFQRARLSARNGKRSKTQMDRALAAWRADGAEETVWAAVNALTWVATHDLELTPRQRRVLSLLGGLLAFSGVHICDRCFSVLSAPAGAGNTDRGELDAA